MKVVGGFILNMAKESLRIYGAGTVAAWLLSRNQKEGSMVTAFNAQSLNLSHFNPLPISYEPKSIYGEAIQITPENIGKLSLEFEVELLYNDQGMPYFVFSAERYDPQTGQPKSPVNLWARVTDWIVPLRNEIHIYRDVMFRNTFMFDEPMPFPHAVPKHVMDATVLGEPSLMSSALASSNTEIREFAGKLRDLKPVQFEVNDRVEVLKDGYQGIVTVLAVEKDGRPAIEVMFDNENYGHFWPEELKKV